MRDDHGIATRIAEAQEFLRRVGLDAERQNERSARILLALLQLEPGKPWPQAANPPLRTVEIIDWIDRKLGHRYKPNTRETIRRQTLHQFADTLLVEQNPDEPTRPVNSPKWCYRIHPTALELARRFGTGRPDGMFEHYLALRPGLVQQYAVARQMNRIPVTLPSGEAIQLSPGGQNILLKKMVEEFCERFTPGGVVLYIGDADAKWAVFDVDRLAALGVTVDSHGKMPDLVVHYPDRNWMVLLEAASSHGPVDAKRHGELSNLFGSSSAGLVFVSCFPSRREMRKYLADIAWETEVWCADNLSHLIHFNGERFLGPYGS
ncbi:MAG: BsuBI/PstI family type II restriction endonuclease [Candidatus Nanopelagicales bacterium]|nr:BsuBI/PstI family type II restriction endonuclease [Candidatus Nanopelagicales bacterium]